MKFSKNLSFMVILSALDLIAAVACAGGAIYFYANGGLIFTVILAVAAIVLFFMLKPLEGARQDSRIASKYDEYGRLKISNAYKKMSAREQAELDRINQMEMERVLPSSTVMSLTHEGSKDPECDMEALIGMREVKGKMQEMAARMEFDRENGVRNVDTCMHMCFFGPPGTGKTTCARIMTGFLYQYGYIKANRLIETDGNFLADPVYASAKTELIIQKAFGGVLFIDEAYTLLNNAAGGEAIATLLKQMEDNKDKFVLIIAGYEGEMRELLRSNPGFKSRIKDYFFFRAYSPDELTQMFVQLAEEEKFMVLPNAQLKFKKIMEEISRDYHFGNARTVRNILDKSMNRHSLNYKNGVSTQKFALEEQDIVYDEYAL